MLDTAGPHLTPALPCTQGKRAEWLVYIHKGVCSLFIDAVLFTQPPTQVYTRRRLMAARTRQVAAYATPH